MTTKSSTNRTVLFGVGVVAAMTGLAAVVGGGALVWGHTTQRGDDGFYSTSTKGFATATSALTSNGVDLGVDPGDRNMAWGGVGVTFRLKVTPTNGKPVFVGVARVDDAEAYLAGVGHDKVTDVNFSPFRVDYRSVPGERRLDPPGSESIWLTSATGTGTQTVTRPARGGDLRIVVMNADGSPGIRADVAVGARTNALLPIGLGAVLFGLTCLVGAGLAFRSASGRDATWPGSSPASAPVAPAAPPAVPVG